MTTRPTSAGETPRVAQGLRCRLYGESVWALVPTVQGRHGDPGDADRFSHEDHLAFVSRGAKEGRSQAQITIAMAFSEG